MSEYPNSGILNPNKFFREGSKMPTHNGKGELTCKHCHQVTAFEIAAWRRNGGKLITLSFTEKELAEKKRAEAKARKAGLATESSQPEQAANNGGVVF